MSSNTGEKTGEIDVFIIFILIVNSFNNIVFTTNLYSINNIYNLAEICRLPNHLEVSLLKL